MRLAMDTPRIAVIGGGVMGLAAAWELTRRGHRPIVLEQFDRGHTLGASHGATRNFNNAYLDDHYLDLLHRSMEGWDALGSPGGAPLLRLHGLVTHGTGMDLAALHTALTSRSIDATMLTSAEASARWSGMRFEGDVLHSPDAGVIRAADALVELERRIVVAGGTVLWNAPVASIEHDGAHLIRLRSGDTLRADRLIVTAGAWTTRILGSRGLPELRVTEESPAHFAPTSGHQWPSFNHYVGQDTYPATVYGMPTPGEGIKVGFHGVGSVVDPDARPHRATHTAALRDYVREWMPGLSPANPAPVSCTYTSSASGDFIMDRRDGIVIGAGFSGHGFKFAPGVGGILADLVLDDNAVAAASFRLSAHL